MESTADILFGKTRQAVLTLLFGQSDKAFYLRELAKRTGISPGAIQREVNQLLKADLLERQEDGNRVTYRANTHHPVFLELQSLIGKTCGLPAQIESALMPYAGSIRFAALYGSFARGQSQSRSDVDLLIVGDLSLNQAIGAVVPVEERLGREVSVRVYRVDEFHERLRANDHFLKGVMDGPLVPIIGVPGDA